MAELYVEDSYFEDSESEDDEAGVRQHRHDAFRMPGPPVVIRRPQPRVWVALERYLELYVLRWWDASPVVGRRLAHLGAQRTRLVHRSWDCINTIHLIPSSPYNFHFFVASDAQYMVLADYYNIRYNRNIRAAPAVVYFGRRPTEVYPLELAEVMI